MTQKRPPRPVAPRPAEGDCAEPAVKPKPVETPLPTYPEAARQAGVEGRARVEITVDETGKVTGVRVLEGPGHGIDEAAAEAVRRWKFQPGTRCGRPVAATFTVRVSFGS